MSQLNIPMLGVDLVAKLDREFPHRCPERGASLEEIHRYAGKRELVDSLLAQLAADQETAEELRIPVPPTPAVQPDSLLSGKDNLIFRNDAW